MNWHIPVRTWIEGSSKSAVAFGLLIADDQGAQRRVISLSVDMALRIGKYFGNGPDIWLRLQTAHDLHHRAIALKDQLSAIPKLKAAKVAKPR